MSEPTRLEGDPGEGILSSLEHMDAAKPDLELVRAGTAPEAELEAARGRAEPILAQADHELRAGKEAVPECEAAISVLSRTVTGK